MEKNNEKKIEKILKIPAFAVIAVMSALIVVIIMASSGLVNYLEGIWIVCMLIILVGIFLCPLPCIVLSVIGIIKAIKVKAKKYIVWGFIEIILEILFVVLAIWLFYIGQSV